MSEVLYLLEAAKIALDECPRERIEHAYFEDSYEVAAKIGEYIRGVEASMINEFDTPEERTENYKKYRSTIGSIALCDLDGLLFKLERVASGEMDGSSLANDAKWVRDIFGELEAEEKCPKCDSVLYVSDLPQYDHLCLNCDENF